jgi:mono/diheme cytochrome c family protein
MMNKRLALSLTLLATATSGACSKSASTSSPTPATSPSASSAPAPAAKPFTAAMVAEGDSIYHQRGCRNCHGMDAKGAANGPTLITSKFMHVNGTYDDFVRIITAGIPAPEIKDASHRIPMPARGGTRPAALTDDQIKSVAAYVYSLNHP